MTGLQKESGKVNNCTGTLLIRGGSSMHGVKVAIHIYEGAPHVFDREPDLRNVYIST